MQYDDNSYKYKEKKEAKLNHLKLELMIRKKYQKNLDSIIKNANHIKSNMSSIISLMKMLKLVLIGSLIFAAINSISLIILITILYV